MRKTLLFVAFALFVLPSVARAQSASCSSFGQDTKVYGCIDLPQNGASLTQQGSVTIQGWALSCFTHMQPSSVQVWYAMPAGLDGKRTLTLVDPRDWSITWRISRPDVQQVFADQCSTTVPYFGYTIAIRADALPAGNNSLAVIFTDPALGYGASIQSIWFWLFPPPITR